MAQDASYAAYKVVCVVVSYVFLMLPKDIVLDHRLVLSLNILAAPAPAASWTGLQETVIIEGVNITEQVEEMVISDLPPHNMPRNWM